MPYPFMEIDVSPNPLLSMTGEYSLNGDGTISVPSGPGVGVELTAARFEQWSRSCWAERL